MKRGIYIVANKHSEALCANLVYSIRQSGCNLSIRLIPYGGKPVQSRRILDEVEVIELKEFSEAGRKFVGELSEVLTCSPGYMYRFFGWFGDWDEFIYTDNDIVALMNWERLFDHLPGNHLVHADEEYTTKGRFNHDQPDKIEKIFGKGALLTALTAGHMVVRRDPQMVKDMRKAVTWLKDNPGIAKTHDQALLHIASLIGGWKMLNLCKPPHNWLSSWAGDYRSPLALIQAMQAEPFRRISHLHFSGGLPGGTGPMADLLNAHLAPRRRIMRLTKLGLLELTGWLAFCHHSRRIKNGLMRRWEKRSKKS